MLWTQMQEFVLVWKNKMFRDTSGRSCYHLKKCTIVKWRGSKGAVLWSQKHLGPLSKFRVGILDMSIKSAARQPFESYLCVHDG